MAEKDRWTDVTRQVAAESDRAAVILAAAAIDSELIQLLKAFLRPVPTGDDSLLDGDSPLGTFSARTKACHRLGLIDDTFAAALNLLRKIRNDFAHEPTGHTLGQSPHRERVNELKRLCRGVEEDTWKLLEVLFPKVKTDSGKHFRMVAAVMLARLQHAIRDVEPVSASKAKPLWPPKKEKAKE